MRKNIKKITMGITLSMALMLGVAQPMFVGAKSAQTSEVSTEKKGNDATSAATQMTHDSEAKQSAQPQKKLKQSEIKAKIKEVKDKIARVKKNDKIPEFGKKQALKELRKELKELQAQLKPSKTKK